MTPERKARNRFLSLLVELCQSQGVTLQSSPEGLWSFDSITGVWRLDIDEVLSITTRKGYDMPNFPTHPPKDARPATPPPPPPKKPPYPATSDNIVRAKEIARQAEADLSASTTSCPTCQRVACTYQLENVALREEIRRLTLENVNMREAAKLVIHRNENGTLASGGDSIAIQQLKASLVGVTAGQK